ncbi:MAG TPA: hypothetical protein VFW95_11265 [Candidatus Limnocylindria bacterium]|nr:hypothetical protein [Candidatus Limnocylindria bacterium]
MGEPPPMAPILTERVLRRLGSPRAVWVLAWALIPLIAPLAFVATVRLSGRPLDGGDLQQLALTQGVLAYVVLVLLVGTGALAGRAASVRRDIVRILQEPLAPPLFGRLGSIRGPLALTALAVVVITFGGIDRYGLLPRLTGLLFLAAYMIPIATFVWVSIVILTDLDRLGRQRLRLDVFPQDRTLGLGDLGALASMGLGLLFVAVVPVMLVAADEPITLIISLVIVAVTVVAFLFSMWRLHLQMAAAKERNVEIARRLYAEAYAPIREKPDLAALEAQSDVLSVAQSLDERAHGLPSWPIDEGTVRFLAVVVTGVITSLVVRGLFAALGF